jgi:hypothetical protein
MASSMHCSKIARSGFGIAGGTVMITLRKRRGVLAWFIFRRCAGLLICISAWLSTSESIMVISELRL